MVITMQEGKTLYFGEKIDKWSLTGLIRQKGYFATTVTCILGLIALYALVAPIPFSGFAGLAIFKLVSLSLLLLFIFQYLRILVHAEIDENNLALRTLLKNRVFHWNEIEKIRLIGAPSTGVYYFLLKKKTSFLPYIFIVVALPYDLDRLKTVEDFKFYLSKRSQLEWF